MFEGILIGLAALCAVYFVVIVLYAGIGTSFAFIWLFFFRASPLPGVREMVL